MVSITGSTRALACAMSRPRGRVGSHDSSGRPRDSTHDFSEGAEIHTRGRVCSPCAIGSRVAVGRVTGSRDAGHRTSASAPSPPSISRSRIPAPDPPTAPARTPPTVGNAPSPVVEKPPALPAFQAAAADGFGLLVGFGGKCHGSEMMGSRSLISISVAARSDIIDVENFVGVFLTGLDDGSLNSGAEPEPSGEFP